MLVLPVAVKISRLVQEPTHIVSVARLQCARHHQSRKTPPTIEAQLLELRKTLPSFGARRLIRDFDLRILHRAVANSSNRTADRQAAPLAKSSAGPNILMSAFVGCEPAKTPSPLG